MMLSHYQHLVDARGRPWSAATAIRGASERRRADPHDGAGHRARPAAGGARLGRPGGEIDGPMAIVILGGLVTSTALNLLVLPTLALAYGRFMAAPR